MMKSISLIILGIIIGFIGKGLMETSELDYEQVTFEVNGENAIMRGIIDGSTIDTFDRLIEDNPNIKVIVMKEVMGSADDEANLLVSKMVREKKLNTYLPKDGMIASGGTDFFCAGVNRTIEEGAIIGVHSWASEDVDNADELAKEDERHKPYLKYYNEMNIPEEFYWFTIKAAPADNMHMMTIDEILKYNIATKIIKADE